METTTYSDEIITPDVIYTNPDTTAALIQRAQGALGDYSAWSGSSNNSSRALSDDELSISIHQSRYRLRFRIQELCADACETISWVERFIPKAGVPLASIEVLAGGSGYTSPPSVTISAPSNGTTATATATIANGRVTAITLTNPGTKYTSSPTITLSGPGTGALVQVHLGTETPKSATWDGVVPANYDPTNPATYPILPAAGYYELSVPETNGTTTVANLRSSCDAWRRIDPGSTGYQIQGLEAGTWQVVVSEAPLSPGEAQAKFGSVDFALGLGAATEGYSLGKLRLYSTAINAATATRTGLALVSPPMAEGQVEQITDAGGLAQIRSAAGLVTLQDASGGGYDLRFYAPGDYTGSYGGPYTVTHGAVPAITYQVRTQPDGAGTRLLIQGQRPGATPRYYLYRQLAGTWSLEQGTVAAGDVLQPDERTTRASAIVSGQPVYVFTELDYGYSPGPLTTIRREFTSAAAAPYTSRIQSIDYPEGRRETFDYIKGTYNATTGVFSPGSSGTYLSTTRTVSRARVTPELWAGHSTRTTTITDATGTPWRQATAVYDGASFVEIDRTLFAYDTAGHLLTETRNGRITYSAQWTGDVKDWEIDETGIKTSYTYWPAGTYTVDSQPVMTATKSGVPATATHAAQPAIVTTYYYDYTGTGGLYVTDEEKSSAGLTTTRSYDQDDSGRPLSIEENGLITGYAYQTLPDGGLRTTITHPSLATEIREEDAQGRLLSRSGTAVVAEYHTYTTDAAGHDVHTAYLGSSTGPTANYVATTTDSRGRRLREESPAYLTDTTSGLHVREFFHDATTGLLVRETSTVQADRLFVYNDFGELWRTGLDLLDDDTLTAASIDAFEQTETAYTYDTATAAWYRVTTRSVARANGSATLSTTGITKERLTLPATLLSQTLHIDQAGQTTTRTVEIDRAAALVTETVAYPGIANTRVTITRNGLLQSARAPHQTQPVAYTHDGLGRVDTLADPARGTVVDHGYNLDDQLETITTRSADSTLSLVETLTYHPQGSPGAGRLATRTTAGREIHHAYDLGGHLLRTWGDTYPVRHEYDALGRMVHLHTYRDDSGIDFGSATWAGGTPDTTTWSYHPATGQLLAKTDAQGRAVRYTYHPSGDLHTRQSARNLTTTYGYTLAGRLQTIDYPVGTPDVGLTYHRDGRLDTLADAAGQRTLSYDATFRRAGETYPASGLLAALAIATPLDAVGRPASAALTRSGAELHRQDHDYAPSTGLLSGVRSGTRAASYTYAPDSAWIDHIAYLDGTTERIRSVRTPDGLGRLQSIETQRLATVPQRLASHGYDFDGRNRRRTVTLADGLSWLYGYDELDQVTSAQKRLADGATPLPGHAFAFDFDAIGNRTETTTNGQTATYTPDSLNQYDQRTVPGVLDVRGRAGTNATVTVNGTAPTRSGSEFYQQRSAPNTGAAVSTDLTITATLATPPQSVTRTRPAFLPKTPEIFVHDHDGNLTQDGRWDYTWDAENRLIAMETRTVVATLYPALKTRLEFAYDAQSRRISKTVKTPHPTTGLWQIIEELRFVYDGWNLLAELQPVPGTTNYNVLRTYTWGLDLSGSMQGAGGVGGLLWTTVTAGLPAASTHVAGYDGNGNVTAWIDMASGYLTGQRDYGPSGEVVQQTGVAKDLPFGFSSKYTDKETGQLYYGFRYYNPSTGRWLSRDPIEEEGGINLYGMIVNDPINRTDFLGLVESSIASQGALILAGKTLQAAGYGTGEIIILLTRMIASKVDWAGEEMLRHLFVGGGSSYTRFDDSSWSNYMMANPPLTRRMQSFWRGKFLEIKRGSNANTVQIININEATPAALARDGWRDFTGYGLINGAIPPGIEIRGKLTSDCANRFSGTFRYTFRDSLDANWGVEADFLFFALAKIGSFGNAQPFEASFSWESSFEFTFNPNSSSGWPF